MLKKIVAISLVAVAVVAAAAILPCLISNEATAQTRMICCHTVNGKVFCFPCRGDSVDTR